MTRNVDRRTVLKAGGSALAAGGLSGCLAGGRRGSGGTTAADTGEATTGSGSAADSDRASTATTDPGVGSTATVEVGPGGRLAFEPSGDRPLVVAAGTTVEFVWQSDVHNVVVDDQPNAADWQGSPGDADEVYDEEFAFSHTFEIPGIYDFHCTPHEAVGMTGTVVVTPDGVAPEYATTDDLPVTVGPSDDPLVFSPGTVRPLTVPVGTEVEFVWESDNHNVVVSDRPETGDWEGTAGGPRTLYDEGHEYSHTFEVPGVYRFHCQPHRPAGMVGMIVVEEA